MVQILVAAQKKMLATQKIVAGHQPVAPVVGLVPRPSYQGVVAMITNIVGRGWPRLRCGPMG